VEASDEPSLDVKTLPHKRKAVLYVRWFMPSHAPYSLNRLSLSRPHFHFHP